ncbi:MAG TPA: acyl carrier protein [Steroidobacteraceae bacterium]|nr:acyl carrier protein [Steroidobacteraceae bacterium]
MLIVERYLVRFGAAIVGEMIMFSSASASDSAFPFASESAIASEDIEAKIRRVLKEHGRLGTDVETLSISDSLFLAGMTSHANVNVMLALENEFEVEFPDQMLKRGTFDSIGSIRSALTRLLPGV